MADHEIITQTEKTRLDFLVDYRWVLVIIVAILTVVFAFFIPRVETDPTIQSALVTTSPSFFEYQKFLDFFDDDEYVVIAIKQQLPADDTKTLEAVKKITGQLAQLDRIAESNGLKDWDS